MKQTVIFISLIIIAMSLFAQKEKDILIINDLGFYNSDSTFGGFDGGMGHFKVNITKYSYDKKKQTVRLKGKVLDLDTDENFCGVKAFIGNADKESNKLSIENQHELDCMGNFDISIDINSGNSLYFYVISYSLLECKIDKVKFVK